MSSLRKYSLFCRLIAVFIVAVLHVTPASSREVFVSTTGADSNEGTMAAPFRTLQKAVADLKPGDVCTLRGGRYRESVQIEGVKGTAEKPIVVRSFPGERAIFDGTSPIPNPWSRHQKNIWKTTLDHDIWQLFCGDKLVDVARWPNASFADGSIWRMEECMRFTDRKYVRGKPTGQTKDGLIHDRNPISLGGDPDDEGAESLTLNEGVNQVTLAESGVDFTGALAVLNLHHWLTWTRPITDHEAGRNWLHYDSQGTEMEKHVAYYILGLPALDRPNEWWYDVDTKTAYFCPPGDRDPNEISISAKVRDYSLRLIDCSHMAIHSLDFFASTFSMTDCEHVVVEDGSLRYPSTNKFVLGDYSWFNASSDPDKINGRRAKAKNRGNVLTRIVNHNDGPHCNVIRNCEIAFANSPAIVVNSPGSIVENCYIHDIEWDLNSSGGSGSLPGGAGCIIRRNTIHTAGNSEGIRPGPGSIVEYNRLWNMGNLQFDGSAINIGTDAQTGTVVRYNWVHNTNRAGIRFDSTQSRMGSSGFAHHNVVFRLITHGSKFKGDHHLLLNNTFYNSYFAIPNEFGNTSAHNRNSLVRNNLADIMVAWSTRRPDEPIPGQLKNNLSGDGVVVQNLRDPANLDFRPRPNSSVIDAGLAVTDADKPSDQINIQPPSFIGTAPDIGAYEAGDRRYWIPGCMQAKASTPIPPNGAIEVKQDADLIFLEAYRADRHIVSFMNEAKDHRGRLDLRGSNIAAPGTLRAGQKYAWRVDAVMPGGKIVEGEPWTFTVEK
jgi:hypothetical protein